MWSKRGVVSSSDMNFQLFYIIRKAILDKSVVVEPGAQIGVDLERDRQRFTVSDGGIVIVGKGVRVTV